MKVRRKIVVLTVALLPLGIALPATADSGAITASVTVTPGSLTIRVPATAGTLASGVSSVDGRRSCPAGGTPEPRP